MLPPPVLYGTGEVLKTFYVTLMVPPIGLRGFELVTLSFPIVRKARGAPALC
jgi:hypothetical protein